MTPIRIGRQSPRNFGLVSSLPTAEASPGDRCDYLADKTNGIIWEFVYDGEGSFPWKKVGGPPIEHALAAQISRSNTAFAAVAPSCELTVPFKGDYDVRIEANGFPSASAERFGVLSYSVGGVAASDAWGAFRQTSGASFGNTTVGKTARQFGLAASAVVKEAIRSGNAAYAFFVEQRRLIVDPVRVG
jgi:hypothetical protein